MSDDELEKLAAAMKNISPSKAARKSGMDAAMAAFDTEFASETAVVTEAAEENISETSQGLSDAPRLTGQTIGTGPMASLGRDTMSRVKEFFTFKPKTMMMAGTCAAALFATSLYIPNTRFEDMPKPAPQAVTAEVGASEAKTAEIAEVETKDSSDAFSEAKEPEPSVAEAPAPVIEPIAPPAPKRVEPTISEHAITEAETKAVDVAEHPTIRIGDGVATIEEPKNTTSNMGADEFEQLETITSAASEILMAEAVPETPSDVVTIQRRVVKTPAHTQERTIPNVTKTATRRILKKPGIPTGRTLPALTKEVSRRVIKTPAATQERVVPAITKEVTGRVKQDDGSFKTVTATVVVQEASTELVMAPPTYETVTETVVVRPAGPEYEPGTAEYETVTETVAVQEASTELVTIPATYETVTETIKIGADGSTTVINSVTTAAPEIVADVSSGISSEVDILASTGTREMASRSGSAPSPVPVSTFDEIIVTGGKSSGSRRSRDSGKISKSVAVTAAPSAVTSSTTPSRTAGGRISTTTAGKFTVFNGVSNQVVQSTETIVSKTGEILCRVMIPAKYKTITKQVLVSPARTIEREVPAVTKDITVRVKTEDGTYKDAVRTFVVKEAWTDIDVIPAVYETRSERILVAPAREEWKPGSEAINAAEVLNKTPIIKPKPKPKPKPRPQSGLLTAGDYDDVLNPDLYKVYLDKMLQGQLKGKDLPYVDANERVSIRVVDSLGKPVPLADISLRTARGSRMFPLRTGADGMAYLYPNYDSLESGIKVKVSAKGARSVTTRLTRKLIKNGGDIVVDLKMESAPVQALDLLLTIDATGSMGDEMRYLQSELKAIVGRVEAANPGVDIRTGLVVYRDKGDDYVVREIPFTDDIEDFRASLAEQNANGGGDKPEAMHTALQTGLDMEWRKDSLKINLLVADAPPHDRYLDETWEAGLISRTKGIHIVPLAASGVDKTAEFVMRSMAQITGGRFLFLTDDSGIGNKHAKPTVDCYVVTRLDGLVTRVLSSLIKGERVEPEASDVIRSVGNYRAGTCAIDEQDIPSSIQTVSYKYKQ